MKNLLLDLLLAFLIWQIAIYFYENTTPEFFLNQEVEKFNTDVENGNVLKDYHIAKETKNNNVANTFSEISDISRKTISVFVEVTMGMLSGFD